MLPAKLTELLGKLDQNYALLAGAAVAAELADDTVAAVSDIVEGDKQRLIEYITHYPDGPEPAEDEPAVTGESFGASFFGPAPQAGRRRENPLLRRMLSGMMRQRLLSRGKSKAEADAEVRAAEAGGIQGLLEWFLKNWPEILAALMKLIELFGGD